MSELVRYITDVSNSLGAPNDMADDLESDLDLLIKRADAAGIDYEVRSLNVASPENRAKYVVLSFPNGRQTRPITIPTRLFGKVLETEFENLKFLGDYEALVNVRSGQIECQVTVGGLANNLIISRMIRGIPGSQTVSGSELRAHDTDFSRDAPSADRWRLMVKDNGVSIEISPATPEFEALMQGGVTIKLDGVTSLTHDESVEALERYAGAMLFDLDLVYGHSIQLSKRRRLSRRRRPVLSSRPPKFPQNRYARQALELYQYGREAEGLPLLEYLAYYQSLEFFFPFFAREQTVNMFRSQLLNPAFDAADDGAVNRLISLAAPAARGFMAEREQLRATIRACMTDSDILDFMKSTKELMDHFCAPKQVIKDVGVIQVRGSQVDLRDQVSDRIYSIRCRIVHAKQDGGGNSEEVLLPSSAEAANLQGDIELLRLVAQRALVARAARA